MPTGVYDHSKRKGVIRTSRVIRTCAIFDCNNTFEILITRSKKYCSRKCYYESEKGIPLHPKAYEVLRKNGGWSKGLTKETDIRVARQVKAREGYIPSEETKQKNREAHLGDKNPAKRPEVRQKMSESRIEGLKTGKIMPPNWKGGLSFLSYPQNWTETLRESIRQRDNNTCQLCGKTQKEEGKRLAVHHIDYVKENLDPDNLTTLCRSCNSRVNGRRSYWTNFFQLRLKLCKVG